VCSHLLVSQVVAFKGVHCWSNAALRAGRFLRCYLHGVAAGPSADYRRAQNDGSRAGSASADSGTAFSFGEPARRRFRPWRVLRIASGFLLLALGVIGLFLPILQGVLMILAGLAVLEKDLPWSRKITDWLAEFVRRRSARGKGAGPTPSRPEAP